MEGVAYRTAGEHLGELLDRVRLMLQRYLRRFSERLVGASERYTDQAIGPGELKVGLRLSPEKDGQDWLDAMGCLSLDQLQVALREGDRYLTSRLEATLSRAPEIELPVERLRSSFHLSSAHLDVLIAAAAPRLCVELSRLYPVAWADFGTRVPTAGFLDALVADDPRPDPLRLDALLGPSSPLVRYRLVRLAEHPRWSPSTPRLHTLVTVDQRVLDLLQGLPPEGRLPEHCALHTTALEGEALIVDEQVEKRALRQLRTRASRTSLIASPGSGRLQLIASHVVGRGGSVLEVDVASLGAERFVSRWPELLREALLNASVLVLRMDDLEDGPESLWRSLAEGFPDFPGPVFATTRRALPERVEGVVEVEFPSLTLEQQQRYWKRQLLIHGCEPGAARATAATLARMYQLTPGVIQSCCELASKGRDGVSLGAVQAIVRRRLEERLGALAQAHQVSLTLDDVVLTEDVRRKLEEILRFAHNAHEVFERWGFARVSGGAVGLSVMFSGPPGTGKTLVSGVLAHALGRTLYRVDLSRVVDKYIGETEKNLGRIFEEAERSQAVLLFDEADSLFAKRTEVKSSNDRYANLEVNYLLQRLEAYRGMCILTTNFATSIDDAFQRRLRFKVAFPMPDKDMRAGLWEKLLPPRAPREEHIDFEALGEAFELTGGFIRNAILRASIEAADAGQKLSTPHLWDAALEECREAGILLPRHLSRPLET